MSARYFHTLLTKNQINELAIVISVKTKISKFKSIEILNAPIE